MQSKRTGSILIVVLAFLAIMALLVITFAAMMQLHRRAARNYLDSVRARLVAESGVAFSIAFLNRSVSDNNGTIPATTSWLYNDTEDTNGNGSWDPGEDRNGNGIIDPLPLEFSQNPSYEMGGVNGTGYTRAVAGTYTDNGDRYKVKITSTSGKIYVNAGRTMDFTRAHPKGKYWRQPSETAMAGSLNDIADHPAYGAKWAAARMLNTLCRLLDPNDDLDLGGPPLHPRRYHHW